MRALLLATLWRVHAADARGSLRADARSADARSTDARSADAHSAHARSADARTAHVRTAHARTAHPCSPAACRHTRSVGPRSAPAVDEAIENERPPRTKPPRIEQSGAMHALSCGVSPARHGLRASRQVLLGESRRLAARRTFRAGSTALTLVGRYLNARRGQVRGQVDARKQCEWTQRRARQVTSRLRREAERLIAFVAARARCHRKCVAMRTPDERAGSAPRAAAARARLWQTLEV